MAPSENQLTLFELPELSGSVPTFKPFRYPVWTESKARLIERYLYYFVLITKHGVYIDGFAGPQEPDRLDTWAAHLVLNSEPRWLRNFFLCDANQSQYQRLVELKASQPLPKPGEPRSIEVLHADFNETVYQVLASEAIGERTATFCLLDQRTFECDWRTLEVLAAHKTEGYKIELFYFLPSGWLDRAISGLGDVSKLEGWWGRSDWNVLVDANGQERVNLFCDRMRDELGYTYAIGWPIYERSDGGRVMYHMIHATDHDIAPNLMARAYRQAVFDREEPEQFRLEFEQWESKS